MPADAPVSDLERRKYVRLRRRGDLSITPQKYEGRTYYVVKDPVSLRYYRFKEQEYFLLQLMDGHHTLDQSQKEFERRFRPERLTLEDLEHFGQQLLTAGLVQNESPQAGKQLFDRRKKRRRRELTQLFTNILYIKIPIFDPEKILTRMLPYFRWMFSMWFLLFSIGVMCAAVFLVLSHFEYFLSRLPSYHEFFSFKTIMYLWGALAVVKVIHEFGHGLSCKAFGGEVHEMGFLLLCLSPAMYCNVSDAWTLPNKWKRIIISGAGIYVELMIAAIATFIWWNSPVGTFLNSICLSLMVVCSVSTVLFNGNPLMRYDGYYVLADWLEIPNLRDRSNRYLQRVVMEHCLGIEVHPEPYMELWRRILFIGYAVLSWVYRWVVTFVILVFLANFLKPYKLEIISNMLAFAAAASMFGWPLYRLGKNIHRRGRLPDMKPTRVTITGSLIALVLLAFFFLPLPVTRIRQPALVQVQPAELAHVHVRTGGTLQKLHVKEGEVVKKGKVLAEFTSLELEKRHGQAKSVLAIKEKVIQLYDRQIDQTRDVREKQQMESARLSARSEYLAAKTVLEQVDEERNWLTLFAPRDGVVLGLPLIDEVGKRWEKDEGTPFCSIGNPKKLRVLTPIPPADFELLHQNLKKVGAAQHLDVTVRVQGLGDGTWQGHVALEHLPSSEAKEIPLGLSSKGGGPLAVQPTGESKQLIPQSQIFLVGIPLDNPDESIIPGTLAQVKIHCEYRSCAWWVWRAISSTFDVPLAF
ncbi:MAG: efflux RND transporter periplasmic adaptor subunit [Gemmataceae bacterium]|nr:efflux RND transporter periplasmic adaptor subunit [Gemmataceae bacterium]MCI0740227.1 efflux RND transporter periplasmic adaptor subunit [Gemmataceae bacterium]